MSQERPIDPELVDQRFAELLGVLAPAVDAGGLPPHEVSPLQGRMLELLARMCGARRILELGTLAGHSTLWLARALPADGELITIEADADHAAVARRNLAGDARIELREGRAEDVLATLAGPFDLVFLDAFKPANAAYLRGVLPLTRPGTVIVADNVVRHEGPADFLQALSAAADATAVQTTGVKGHDGFVLALVRGPAGSGRAPTA
jgi:predicted O-methyltransferase YrrM